MDHTGAPPYRQTVEAVLSALGTDGRTGLSAAEARELLLQLAVVYIPVLQKAFTTTSLSLQDWALCTTVGSSVLWLRELGKLVARYRR